MNGIILTNWTLSTFSTTQFSLGNTFFVQFCRLVALPAPWDIHCGLPSDVLFFTPLNNPEPYWTELKSTSLQWTKTFCDKTRHCLYLLQLILPLGKMPRIWDHNIILHFSGIHYIKLNFTAIYFPGLNYTKLSGYLKYLTYTK